MAAATLIFWITDSPIFYTPYDFKIFGWESGAHLDALREVEAMIPPGACVVAENNVQPHYSIRPETYVLGARGDMDGCTYMVVDLGDRRHDDFGNAELTACSQFWAQKRRPIYFRDTVVVLQQMPVDSDSVTWHQMQDYCTQFASEYKGP
jgi:hypothetical protein